MQLFERLLLPQNLAYAWIKARRLYQAADGYTDYTEIAEFELNLEARLNDISTRFSAGSYIPAKLRPLPRPKKNGEDGAKSRQYFHVSIDDQVAWIAVVNVLGPELDKLMPPWSYGNRIFRPAWYEDDLKAEEKRLEIGPYRHSNGQLYRRFQHSWPLFRRHVALTARTMSRAEHEPLRLDLAETLAELTAEREGLHYLKHRFWNPPIGSDRRELFHASVDLKQFFPSISRDAILRALETAPIGFREDSKFNQLVREMLAFEVDFECSFPKYHEEIVEPAFDNFAGIPTGLFVSGFLSNAAMWPIDDAVNKKIDKYQNVAHFRFVDDHTIIAYTFDDLLKWVREYEELLGEFEIGVQINFEKCDPEQFARLLYESYDTESEIIKDTKAAIEATKLDGRTPTKLLTKTLGQISALAAAGVDTLDDEDLNDRLNLLEWLLLADIPDREIRADTRAAFAAGQISKIAPLLTHISDELVQLGRLLAEKKTRKKLLDVASDNSAEKELTKEIESLSVTFNDHWETFVNDEKDQLARCFRLLMQAFREHPTKARLFFRLHEYCRVTGYSGLRDIAKWLPDIESQAGIVWRNYYTGLSLQLMADGVLRATRTLLSNAATRSQTRSATRYLEHIADLGRTFLISTDQEAWYQKVARFEFSVSILAASSALQATSPEGSRLASALIKKRAKYQDISFDERSSEWKRKTGYSAGVWAHKFENLLSIEDKPSGAWRQFERCFSYSLPDDLLAVRRYPQGIPREAWNELLSEPSPLKTDDAGWLVDSLLSLPPAHKRRREAKKAAAAIISSSARALKAPRRGWITLYDWTDFLRSLDDQFDPRRGEWTALEIVRQVTNSFCRLSMTLKDTGDYRPSPSSSLHASSLHPINVIIHKKWIESETYTWDEWRRFCQSPSSRGALNGPKIRDDGVQISDYRYSHSTSDFFKPLGRLLLGILVGNFDAPKLWNLRGNEQVHYYPSYWHLESLGISSRTVLLIDACLGKKSEENRLVLTDLGRLFVGMDREGKPNDTEFDPPDLVNLEDLLDEIVKAQAALERNQISITYDQPRQLIPFAIRDFATGSRNTDEGQSDVE